MAGYLIANIEVTNPAWACATSNVILVEGSAG
jgi:hypothetical protein